MACCGPLVFQGKWARKKVRREVEGDKSRRQTVDLLSLTCLLLIYLLLQACLAEVVPQLWWAAKDVLGRVASERILRMDVLV